MRHELGDTYTRRDLLKMASVIGAGAMFGRFDHNNQGSKLVLPGSPNTHSLLAMRSKEARFASRPSWEQNFSKMPDGKLDPRYWSMDTGNLIPSYNKEAQTLTDRPENVRIQNGLLIIEARKERLNNRNYTSGHINTQDKFSFMYGKLEVDLKAPSGIGVWPAAWLLPNAAKATWPLDGEIDFFEGVGAQPNEVYPAVHTANTEASGVESTEHIIVPNETTGFNTYGVELTPGKIAFTFNGKEYHSVTQTSDDIKEWPFNQDYYLILNIAMGGSWGGELRKQYPPDGIQGDGPWEMAVRSVRYFDLES